MCFFCKKKVDVTHHRGRICFSRKYTHTHKHTHRNVVTRLAGSEEASPTKMAFQMPASSVRPTKKQERGREGERERETRLRVQEDGEVMIMFLFVCVYVFV